MAKSLTTERTPANAPDSDQTLLEEIRERFDLASNFWRPIRAQGAIDMRYVAGDPWDPKDRAARNDAGRPCLSLDELGQYFNQVINDVRANPRGVQFSPTGDGANDEAARFYQDKMREIEYRSHAQIAYTTAFQNTVERSYGWVRLYTKYQPKSLDQDLWIGDIPNPDLVLSDPDAKRPDSSDMRYLFHYEIWDQKEFLRAYPKAEVTNFGEWASQAPSWINGDKVVLAEYWRLEIKKKKVLRLQSPDGRGTADFYEDELAKMPPNGIVVGSREEEVPSVMQYLTNGVEILKKTPWVGTSIPFASCFGKRIYVDDGSGPKLQVLSMTRLARDPYMLYCYYATSEAEVVGRVPKIPAIGYEGQFRGHEVDWQKSMHQPMAFLQVKPTTEATGGQVLPLPQMQVWEPPIQALAIGKEGARRAIQAAMGTNFLPTQAQRRSEKSGVALKQIEDTAQKGSYHFLDSYDTMIRRVGEMIEDLMDKVYDTARDVGVRKADDTAEVVRINDPLQQDSISTKGRYLVTVSTGPAKESEREAASDFADQLAANPQVFAIIGDLVVKLKNLGPIGDKIADRLRAMLPPQIQQLEAAKGEKADPQALLAQLAQMQEQVAGLTKVANEQAQIIQTDTVKSQRDVALEAEKQKAENERAAAELAIKQAELALKQQEIAFKNRELEVKLEIEMAKLGSAQMLKRGEIEAEQLHQHGERLMRQQELGAASAQADLDRQNERDVKTAEIGVKAREGDENRRLQREEGAESRALEQERMAREEAQRPEA